MKSSVNDSIVRAVTTIATLFTVAAAISLVWPGNNPLVSGGCLQQPGSDGACAQNHLDLRAIGEAIIFSAIPIAFCVFAVVNRRRYARILAVFPLLVYSFFGVFVFGPVFVPATVVMIIAALMPAMPRDTNVDLDDPPDRH